MGLLSSGVTDVGQKRKINQDSIYLGASNSNLYVVADGMGGHKAGEVASAMATDLIPKYISEHKDENMVPSELFAQAVQSANLSIKNLSEKDAQYRGMGTTVVGLYFNKDHLYLSNVGDSRGYLINQGKLYQLSRDHSLIQEKLNLGIYNREQAARDPQKNILARSVGFEAAVAVDVFAYKVCKNDLFLICSDGLHGCVSDADIIHLVNKYIPNPQITTQSQLEEATQALIERANKNGGPDNVSVILVLTK